MRSLEGLFTSKVRVRILRALLFAGSRELYERELFRKEDIPLGGGRRELARLRSLGLVLTRRTVNRRFYRANAAHGLYLDLKQLFLKTGLLDAHLRKLEDLRRKIRVAFVFGSSARGDDDEASDLDFAVVGSISGLELSRLLADARIKADRPVNSVRFSEAEFREKLRRGDRFVREIVQGPKIFILGGDHDLRRLVEEGTPPTTDAEPGGRREPPGDRGR